jgi:rhodanese-related sulfurtransferase/DNA-binding transcriptional ArsR family regulator
VVNSRILKEELLSQFARVAKSLASSRRLEILEVLAQGPRSVDHLAQATQLPMANVSHHLQILRGSGLVQCHRVGVQMIYALSDEMAVSHLISSLRNIACAQLSEVDRIVREMQANEALAEPIASEELLQRIRAEEVIVIDVRPRQEYEAGHIQGAISIPLEELHLHFLDLPRDREIVAYCRGPYCILGTEAAQRLHAEGFRVRRLGSGFPEWKSSRMPVETG